MKESEREKGEMQIQSHFLWVFLFMFVDVKFKGLRIVVGRGILKKIWICNFKKPQN